MSNNVNVCDQEPMFVVVEKTNTGYNLKNNIVYDGPFAKHKLQRLIGANHPSLFVSSTNWGNSNKPYISGVVTGKAGVRKIGNTAEPQLMKNDNGYHQLIVAGKPGRLGSLGESASKEQIANIAGKLSTNKRNIPYRGSPLEFKRVLDYIQFYMVKKVNDSKDLYLARPNNAYIMNDIRTTDDFKEVYQNFFINNNNATLYKNPYFMSFDRIAAFASVIRNIPTIFVRHTPRTFIKIDKKDKSTTNVIKLRQLISQDISKIEKIGVNEDRTLTLIKDKKQFPLISKIKNFTWFLNTDNFYKLNLETKAIVFYYWLFFYPDKYGTQYTPNIKLIEYALSIQDSFHDFGKDITKFPEIWPNDKNKKNFINSEKKSENGISSKNIPKTSNTHKFLVKLLGIDIYRAVNRYDENVRKTLSITNTREVNSNGEPLTNAGLKVAHLLFLITNIFGHTPSGFSEYCEKYANNLMGRLVTKNNTFNQAENKRNNENYKLCKELSENRGCLVIDAIGAPKGANGLGNSSCLKALSVYHNVGMLDTAGKGLILKWSMIPGVGCPQGIPIIKKRKVRTKNKATLKARSATASSLAAAAAEKRLAANAAAKEKAARNAANAAAKEKAARNARVAKRGRNNRPITPTRDNGQETATSNQKRIRTGSKTPARGNGQEMMNINNPSVTAIPENPVSARPRTPARGNAEGSPMKLNNQKLFR